MIDGAQQPTMWERFKTEGGWVALVISLILGQAGVDAILMALVEPPSLGVEGGKLFVQVFLVTAPLATAAAIFFSILFSGEVKGGPQLVFLGLGALAAGAFVGTKLGSLGVVSLDTATILASESAPTAIHLNLTAYYVLYGMQYFVSALILGGFFGRWAAELWKKN